MSVDAGLAFVKYRDEEGDWFCPIDPGSGKIINNVRLDAAAFARLWQPGIVLAPDCSYMGKMHLGDPEVVKGFAHFNCEDVEIDPFN